MKPVLPKRDMRQIVGSKHGPDDGPREALGPAARVLDEALSMFGANKEAALLMELDESALSKMRRGDKSIPWHRVLMLLAEPRAALALCTAICEAAGLPVPEAPRRVSTADAERELLRQIRAFRDLQRVLVEKAAKRTGHTPEDYERALDEGGE